MKQFKEVFEFVLHFFVLINQILVEIDPNMEIDSKSYQKEAIKD